MYRVELRRRAQRALGRLPQTDLQKLIEEMEGLARTPRPRGTEKIRGTDLWRIRQGDYRIVYAVDDDRQLVTVVRIGRRPEINRSL